MSLRRYLPSTLESLATIHANASVPAGHDAIEAPDDSEEGEYAALMTAADASAELLAGPGRRVVIVAEVEKDGAEIPLRHVVAVHVDTEDGAAPDDDLAWFAPHEISELVAGR